MSPEKPAEADWLRQQERSNLAILKLMVWISLTFGRAIGRVVLVGIAAYFVLFSPKARRFSRAYLQRALERWAEWSDGYRHVFSFASTIHDRIYLLNDRFDLFDIEVIGAEAVNEAARTQPGVLLIGAHLGSFEVLRAVGRGREGLPVAMLMYEENARKINTTLEAINPAASQDIIPLGRMDSMLQARDKLDAGYAVGMLGRRRHHRLPFPRPAGTLPGRPLAHGRHAAPAGLLHDRALSGRQPLPAPFRAAGRLFANATCQPRRCDPRRHAALRRPPDALLPPGAVQLVQFLRFLAEKMIKRLLGYLLLIAVALPASAAFDIGQLMGDLARHKGGKAKFVEKKYFAILDKPVVSTGEMTYTAPDRLEKRTLTPKVETLLLDKDILSIERDKQKLSINLANQPEALAFVDSIRGTLSGNRAALEKNYALHLAGNADKWVLTLLPSDQKIASLVQRITVSGSKNQVRVIEYLQADGDRSVLNIDPVDAK